MFGRIILSAFLAGLVAGLIVTGLQRLQVVPIILEAETYEDSGAAGHSHGAQADESSHDVAASLAGQNGLYARIKAFHNAEADWEPADGGERIFYTAVANVLIAIGFALLLAAIFSLRQSLSIGQGLLWGIGGYLTCFALPALGLPPEIPGTFAAELVDRQGWWLLTALCTSIGLALIVFQAQWVGKIAGALLVVVPFLIGAPHPSVHGGAAPQELADAFIWATALVNGVFWLLLGGLTALFFKKMLKPG